MARCDTRRIADSGKVIGSHNSRKWEYRTILHTPYTVKDRKENKLPPIFEPPDEPRGLPISWPYFGQAVHRPIPVGIIYSVDV